MSKSRFISMFNQGNVSKVAVAGATGVAIGYIYSHQTENVARTNGDQEPSSQPGYPDNTERFSSSRFKI